MPIFQLMTFLLLLTESHFSVRPSQPTATSALQLVESSPSFVSFRAANDSQEFLEIQNKVNLTETSNVVANSDFDNMFNSVSGELKINLSDLENRFCDNCTLSKRTLKSLSYRSDPLGLSEWPQDGVLPFYRIRSDLQRSSTKVVTILGLFEMSTSAGERAEGRSELAAALLAIRHINQRKVLGEFQLRILTNDTKVSYLVLQINKYVSYFGLFDYTYQFTYRIQYFTITMKLTQVFIVQLPSSFCKINVISLSEKKSRDS